MQSQQQVSASCPECASPVAFGEPPRLSEIVDCPECQCELEVVTVDPPTLAPAPDIEEDWGE